jgi:glycosyltransferase involved in cell wall biosynthesis
MGNNIKILYDPEYNFHPGFHGPIFDNLPSGLVGKNGNLKCYFEDSVRSNTGTFLAEQFFALGNMNGEGDVIFSPHILLTNNKPWIIDLEHVIWLFTDEYTDLKEETLAPYWKRKIAEELLSSKFCLKILCYSELAKKSVIQMFPNNKGIYNKSLVFHPPQMLRSLKIQTHDNIRLLFICAKEADYYRKGGDVAFKVFSNLKKEFPKIEMIYVGNVPANSEFHSIKNDFGFIHSKSVSHKEMFDDIYPQSDILLFPSRADTFGMVVSEAMSCGLTVIASSGNHVFGLKDLIRNGTNGFLVSHSDSKPSYSLASNINVEEFTEKTKSVVGDKELRRKISYNATQTFKNGSFSIPFMQKQLKEIISPLKYLNK